MKLFPRSAGFGLLVGFLILPAVLAEGLTPEQLVDLKKVTAVAMDPDAERVAYTLTVPRDQEDEPGRAFSELWLAAKGLNPRPFVSAPSMVSDPAWSPDGNWITFLDKREQHHAERQVYAIFATGGEARPLTRHPTGVLSYRWSPDGKKIAFIAQDEQSEEEKEQQEKGQDWIVHHEDLKHQRLWVMDYETRESRPLYSDPRTSWDLIWTPDSQKLIFLTTDKPLIDDSYMFQEIYEIEIDGGPPRRLFETEGKLGTLQISPDGDKLAFIGAVSLSDPLAQSLFVADLDGGQPRNLTRNREATSLDLAWIDNQHILLVEIQGEQNALSRVNVSTGEDTEIVWSGLIIEDIHISSEDEWMAIAGHTPLHPSEAFLATVDGRELIRLSHHNPVLTSIDLADQEVVEWDSGGEKIRGVLTYPLDYTEGRKYPLLLQIHGGPEGVSLNGWTSTATYPVQVLAAAGYLILQPNYRGSGGRGVLFSQGDHLDLGGLEFEDVLAGIDTLIDRGLVDPDRVGTGGWSYGGYFSAWGATRHSQRFRAAVVGAGIANWISFAGTTDIPFEMSLVHWNSWWFDRPELHWSRSPLAFIEDAQTPTLIVHGLEDDRVHPEQGLELYNALRIKGVPSRLVLYPREPHGLLERAHQLDYIHRVLNWFDKYVRQ